MCKEELIQKCLECKKECPTRIIAMYINDVGYDYFCYQMDNQKLPKQIQTAIAQSKIVILVDNLLLLNSLLSLFAD